MGAGDAIGGALAAVRRLGQSLGGGGRLGPLRARGDDRPGLGRGRRRTGCGRSAVPVGWALAEHGPYLSLNRLGGADLRGGGGASRRVICCISCCTISAAFDFGLTSSIIW